MKTHRYRMRMLHKQHNGRPSLIRNRRPLLPLLLHQLLVKLHKQKCLILYCGEEVMFSNEFEDVRATKAEEIGKGLARLTVGGVSVMNDVRGDINIKRSVN